MRGEKAGVCLITEAVSMSGVPLERRGATYRDRERCTYSHTTRTLSLTPSVIEHEHLPATLLKQNTEPEEGWGYTHTQSTANTSSCNPPPPVAPWGSAGFHLLPVIHMSFVFERQSETWGGGSRGYHKVSLGQISSHGSHLGNAPRKLFLHVGKWQVKYSSSPLEWRKTEIFVCYVSITYI